MGCVSSNEIVSAKKYTINQLQKCNLKTPLFSLKGQKHQCKVVKCYDGDTVHVVFFFHDSFQRFKIRLLGINSPELKSKDTIEKQRAHESKKRITDLILNKIIYIECGDFDKYGRLLGTLRINENDKETINQKMIREGHAVPYMV